MVPDANAYTAASMKMDWRLVQVTNGPLMFFMMNFIGNLPTSSGEVDRDASYGSGRAGAYEHKVKGYQRRPWAEPTLK